MRNILKNIAIRTQATVALYVLIFLFLWLIIQVPINHIVLFTILYMVLKYGDKYLIEKIEMWLKRLYDTDLTILDSDVNPSKE